MNEKKYCRICGNKISEVEYDFNNCICYKCSLNEWNDKLADCGYRMADDEGYLYFERSDGVSYDECGKTFNFTVNIEVTYSTSRKGDEE